METQRRWREDSCPQAEEMGRGRDQPHRVPAPQDAGRAGEAPGTRTVHLLSLSPLLCDSRLGPPERPDTVASAPGQEASGAAPAP